MASSLAGQILAAFLEDNNERRQGHSSSSYHTGPSAAAPHTRADSISSATSVRHSDSSSSTPSRPPRSPLRSSRQLPGSGPSSTNALMSEFSNLQFEVTSLLAKIFEIEELRHSPSLRAQHASQLDLLLSEVHEAIEQLVPHMAPFESGAPDMPELAMPLLKDWNKAIEQHALVKHEMKEDPWLVRFRTSADQVDNMLDPMEASLRELTSFTGRILSSYEPVDGATIERLRTMADSHHRLTGAYRNTVPQILNLMAKNVANRTVKNGESLRRLNDTTTRWAQLRESLARLDGKIDLALAQTIPVTTSYFTEQHPHEMLQDEEHVFMPSAKLPSLEVSNMGASPSRVLSAGGNMLVPPSPGTRTGSVTPNAQRTLRPSVSRPNLVSHQSYAGTPHEKPRWQSGTRPDLSSPPPMPPIGLGHGRRRLSYGGSSSFGGSQHGSTHSGVQGAGGVQQYGLTPTRRVGSPALSSPPGSVISNASRVPHKATATPRKLTAEELNRLNTPARRRDGMTVTARPSLPPGTPGMRPRPSGVMSPNGLRRGGFATPGGRGPPPPSAFRVTSPCGTPGTPARPGSRSMSVSSVMSTVHTADLKQFAPSPYDRLDSEVQKTLEDVGFDGFVARLDQALRRGQVKAAGDQWVGDFVFGRENKKTSVKVLDMNKGKDKQGKPIVNTKLLVRYGGAWIDLRGHLRTKMAEMAQEILESD